MACKPFSAFSGILLKFLIMSFWKRPNCDFWCLKSPFKSIGLQMSFPQRQDKERVRPCTHAHTRALHFKRKAIFLLRILAFTIIHRTAPIWQRTYTKNASECAYQAFPRTRQWLLYARPAIEQLRCISLVARRPIEIPPRRLLGKSIFTLCLHILDETFPHLCVEAHS